MNTSTRLTSILALASTLALGCGAAATQNEGTTAAARRDTGSNEASRRAGASSGRDHAGECAVSSVHFGYDSSELDGRARNTLEANARCIQAREGRASVTGMTDPRGTEEYNLALGDRRARTATSYMTNVGAEPTRMQVRSLGEEHAAGEDEAGWAHDRRAEIELR